MFWLQRRLLDLLIEHHARDGRYDHLSSGLAQGLVIDLILPDHDSPLSRRQGACNIGIGGIVDDENVGPTIIIGVSCYAEHERVRRAVKKREVGANITG